MKLCVSRSFDFLLAREKTMPIIRRTFYYMKCAAILLTMIYIYALPVIVLVDIITWVAHGCPDH